MTNFLGKFEGSSIPLHRPISVHRPLSLPILGLRLGLSARRVYRNPKRIETVVMVGDKPTSHVTTRSSPLSLNSLVQILEKIISLSPQKLSPYRNP